MKVLQAKQGQGGLPAAPAAAKAAPVKTAFAASAPPPEQNVAVQINEQAQEADRAEKEAVSETAAAAPATEAPTIALGQRLDELTEALDVEPSADWQRLPSSRRQ